jgi:glycosyltransferase involved in cell wall biosynthesis
MFISVCIPTYNRLADLKIAIASVITAANILDELVEIIVSDNASPDDTRNYLENLTIENKKITFVYWTNKENIGGLNNVKKLLSKARGDYFFFLTDDDLVLPNAFLLLKKHINLYAANFIKFANITYLIKRKKTFFYGHPQLLNDFDNHDNFFKIESYTHILSGCVIKNIPSLIEVLKNSTNAYISTEMCALSAGACLYINEPVVIHQWENEVFWEKDVDLTSISTKTKDLSRSAQHALLKIPDNYFNKRQKRKMCESLLKRHGYLEIEIQKKFKLSFTELTFIKVRALSIRALLKSVVIFRSFFSKLLSNIK